MVGESFLNSKWNGESWDSSQSRFSSLISEVRKLESRDTEMTCSGPCKRLMAKWGPWRGHLYFMTTAPSTPWPSISKHWFIPFYSSHTSVSHHIYLSCVSFSWILYLTLTSGTIFFPSSSQKHTLLSTHYPSDNALSLDLTNTRNTVPISMLFPHSRWPSHPWNVVHLCDCLAHSSLAFTVQPSCKVASSTPSFLALNSAPASTCVPVLLSHLKMNTQTLAWFLSHSKFYS